MASVTIGRTFSWGSGGQVSNGSGLHIEPGFPGRCQGLRQVEGVRGASLARVPGPSSRRGPGGKLAQDPGSLPLPGPVAIRPSDLSSV